MRKKGRIMLVEYDSEIELWLKESWAAHLDWDDSNLCKLTHAVTQIEIEEIFSNPFFVAGRIVPPADSHWPPEKRFVVVGKTNMGRMLTVVWTTRNQKIRPISMRSSANGEKRRYKDSLRNG